MEDLRSCAKCKLHRQPFAGPDTRLPGADILIVGEATGSVEGRTGIPMTGKSGMLMRRLMARVGLRRRYWIANILYHHPPGNRDPEDDEIVRCLPWTLALIEEMNPRAIICVGKYSAKHIGGFKGAIGHNHGRVIRRGGRLIAALYHPAYLYRKRGSGMPYRNLEAGFIRTLEEVKERLDGDDEIPHYAAILTDGVSPPDAYAFDIETYQTQKGDPDGRVAIPVMYSVHDGLGTFVSPVPCQSFAPFADFKGTPIGHNIASFDVVVAMRYGMPRPSAEDDTMIKAHMCGERHLGLKDLSRKHLGVTTMDYVEMTETEGWGPKINYSAQDAVLAWRISPVLNKLLGPALPLYRDVEMRLAPILGEASLRGLTLDGARVLGLAASEEAKVHAVHEQLMTFAKFNPNSHDQKREAIEQVVGIKVSNAQRETLSKAFSRTHHPFLRLLIAYSVAFKAASTYLRKMVGQDTISCRWDQCGTETGRLSSKGPNLTNLPHRISRCIRAPDGMVLIIGDYPQLELRIAAWVSQDKAWLEDFRTGRDPHSALCQAIYGVETPTLRVRAKSANFEVQYGGGADKLALMLGVSRQEGAKIHRVHRQRHPGFWRWVEGTQARARTDGQVTTLHGRTRRLWDIDSEDPSLKEKALREAINTPIQGPGGDITKKAMVLADGPAHQLGGWVPHQVHDSVFMAVPTESSEEGRQALIWAMTEALPRDLRAGMPWPIAEEVKVSTHWE